MSSLYDDFEKRFTNAWFSAGWSEIEVKPQQETFKRSGKDLNTLQAELEGLKYEMENINEKQIRLANLAKFYQTGEFSS